MRKILQISPADGWYAVYRNDGESDIWAPLACWGLYEDEEGTAVDGMDGNDSVEFSDHNSNFHEYRHNSERPGPPGRK